MRWLVFTIVTLLVHDDVRAGSVEPFGGEVMMGKVELEFGGILLRPPQGAAIKLDFNNLYRVQFSDTAADECTPGVMLRDGSRLAAPFGPLNEPAIRFPKRNLSIPAGEIAWIIYQRFPAALAGHASAGQTGALLPGGDFFSGAVRGADAEAVKVFNAIFGLRRLEARQNEVLAAVLRAARPMAAQYEIRTADGGLLGAENFGADRTGLTLRHALYDGLTIPVGELVEIRAGANRCRPLATLPQLHAEPPAGLRILPGAELVTDAKTVTTCAVPAGFSELIARVAPAGDSPAGQRLIFTIYADGHPVARSAALAVGDPAQTLRATLNGVRGLTLRVEAGAGPAATGSGRWMQAFFLRR